jgi:uncharacterized protein
MRSRSIPSCRSSCRTVTLLVLCALLAGACTTASPPMRYYLLTPVDNGPVPGIAPHEQTVIVGPFQLPGYLDRPQLMVRLADGELALREYDRWAEPLEAVLVRTLAENLVRLTGSQRIITFPLDRRASVDQRISGRVIRFDTDATGLAVLQLQWSIRDGSGRPLVPVQISEYHVQAAGDVPAERVAALSETLALFAAELAIALVAAQDAAFNQPTLP